MPKRKYNSSKRHYGRKKRKYSRRRFGTSKSGYRNTNGPRIMRSSPFPVSKRVNLVFANSFTINAPANGAETIFFAANDIFDPDGGSALLGSKPLFTDDMYKLYDHSVVIGAKLELWPMPTGSTASSTTYMFNISMYDTVAAPAVVDTIITNASAKTFNVTSQGSRRYFTYKVNPNKFLGRSKPLSDPELKGNQSGKPQEECYFGISCWNPNAAINPDPVACQIRITYSVVFIERKKLPL